MPVITISRGTLAGATSIAEHVATELHIPSVSRSVVVETAEGLGVPEEKIEQQMNRPPSFFHRDPTREVYLLQLRSTLLQRAVEGSFVYEGHGGHFLLSDLPTLLRVRVIAPMSFRIEAASEALGLDARAAAKHIRRVDLWREKWVRYLYRADWHDPSFYDLVINLEKLDVDEARDLVTRTAALDRFAWTDEHQQKAADLALAAKISAELARSGQLFCGVVEISASANIVFIDGRVRSARVREELFAAAEQAVAGFELRFEVITASENTGWPS